MLSRRRLTFVAVAVAICRAGTAPAAEPPSGEPAPPLYLRFKGSLGYHYSSGHYGNPERTDIQYVPLVLTADVDRWRLQATIPYLHISGPPGIVEGPDGPIQTTNGTADGLGDLLAAVSYLVPMYRLLPADYASPPWIPFVDLTALLKIPTASRSDGLGTGEVDFGIEAELLWVIGKLMPFVSAGYRYLGSPPGSHLDDVAVVTVGAQYQIVRSFTGGLLLDYRGAPTPTTGQRLELVPYATWLFFPPWSLDGYGLAGLAQGSPDAGAGVQLGYTW